MKRSLMPTSADKPRMPLRVWLADLTHNHGTLGADTFPLGVGCIAAYAEKQFAFDQSVRLFRYPHVMAGEVERNGCPDVVGFSNYIWNCRLGLAFARRIKDLRPDTVVVMGGPNYPLQAIEQVHFLRNNPQIDFVVMYEGEVVFAQLLQAIQECGLDKDAILERVPSIHALLRDGRAALARPSAPRLRNLDDIPSPYLTGKFDEFFDGRLWPLLQTKRGCPFTCTFCSEGESYYTKVARYSSPRIRDEIDYIGTRMAKVRMQGGRNDLYIADSNFGMFPDDLETAQALARSRALHQWPDHINASTGKNQKQRVLEAARILDGSIVLSGSVQTLDPLVLQNVKRANISAPELMALGLQAKQVGANSYCELILGLPGETKKSHFQTLKTTVTAGFNKILPYQLMILSGSELGSQAHARQYTMDIRSRVLPRAFGDYEIAGQRLPVADIEDVGVATDTLSFDDYLDCRAMHLVITIFFNDAIFESVRKILRAQGLSVFRWLELIHDAIPHSGLAILFQEFRDHTKNELWTDRQALEKFIESPGAIERYLRGELGFNLLYTFKAMAITQNLDAVREVVQQATTRLLREGGLIDPELQSFLDQTIQWDSCRVTNIVDHLDDEVVGAFTYDLERFAADPDPVNYGAYWQPAPLVYSFELGEDQKDLVRRYLNTFGADSLGVGRILSVAYTNRMFRRPLPLRV
ncbi:MAG TPA: cobalamin-dependent protein [Gemmataceae bacterium]|nr:cobalamin-dependent protein [Gemmataceae bacterium]